jgi:hypothetical protein
MNTEDFLSLKGISTDTTIGVEGDYLLVDLLKEYAELQDAVNKSCNKQNTIRSFSYFELKTAFEQARCNDHTFDDWYSFNYR